MIDEKADRFIYLDANVFIYFVEGAPELAEPVAELLTAAESSFATGANLHNLFITSELTLAEALASRTATDDERQVYSELLLASPAIFPAPINRDILWSAAEMRRKFGFKLADAIHVATASHHNCSILVSNDSDMRKVEKLDMIHVEPTKLGLSRIIEALSDI